MPYLRVSCGGSLYVSGVRQQGHSAGGVRYPESGADPHALFSEGAHSAGGCRRQDINALRDILESFRTHRIDILLGTQMISKGLDFPRVTLVGVLNADLGLNVPDPRAAERTFQLLTQVAGRAGRGAVDGEVIIQTYSPQAAAIQFARRHDTDGFVENELGLREKFAFPPFTHMAVLTVRSTQEDMASFAAETLHKRLLSVLPAEVEISDPMPAPIAKAYGQFRFQCVLKAPRARTISDIVSAEIKRLAPGEDITVTLDVDAYNFM